MAKFTIRLSDRDDKDLLVFLKGKNASRTFKDALRSQIGQDSKLKDLVRQEVARDLYDLFAGFKRTSDLLSPPCGATQPTGRRVAGTSSGTGHRDTQPVLASKTSKTKHAEEASTTLDQLPAYAEQPELLTDAPGAAEKKGPRDEDDGVDSAEEEARRVNQ